MRMSQKTGLYHITAFFEDLQKRLLRRMRRKMVFSIEKNLAYYLFFLLLSFRSKMRMIEVFVLFLEMRGRKKEKEESCETIVGNP